MLYYVVRHKTPNKRDIVSNVIVWNIRDASGNANETENGE